MAISIVTGGAGFIGSHLCERLLEEGHEVICIDNLITGKLKNIKHLTKKSKFSFIRHDASKYFETNEPIDCIFHLASPASPDKYQENPIDTISANAFGTHNFLVLAKRCGAKFLLASTSEIYGDPQVHPQPETYYGHVNPIGIRSCYDESKRVAEALVMAFIRAHNIDARIVRIFNTYGPKMSSSDGRVIPNFIMQALTGQQMTVYGDGKQTRSFCYISDLIEGICKAIFLEKTKGEVINLGNPCEFTILELANIIKQITNSNSEIVFSKPLPQDDPIKRKPDITKAKSLLDWEPKINLHEGLQGTINFFKQGLNNSK